MIFFFGREVKACREPIKKGEKTERISAIGQEYKGDSGVWEDRDAFFAES